METRSAQLGIAITTFNRSAVAVELVQALATTTTSAYELVVCDDGSTDDTVAALRSRGVRVVSGRNRGIAWNKNRGLFYLLAYTTCEVVLLLDDDVLPTCVGWECDWMVSALRLGHVNLAHPQRPDTLIGGRCDSDAPGLATMISGWCIGCSRRALAEVGYMDTRFRGYGYEHAEFTLRFLRAGYGGALWRPLPHHLVAYYYVIASGLTVRDVPNVSDYSQAEANRRLSLDLREEDIYRHAWRNDAERNDLLTEIRGLESPVHLRGTVPSDFDPAAYLRLNPDVAQAGFDPLFHYVMYGAAERRRWRDS